MTHFHKRFALTSKFPTLSDLGSLEPGVTHKVGHGVGLAIADVNSHRVGHGVILEVCLGVKKIPSEHL